MKMEGKKEFHMKASSRFKGISVAVVSVAGVFQSQTSWTMGKSSSSSAPSSPVAAASPSPTVPNPVRYVVIRDFAGVAPLEAPNGVTTSVADALPVLKSSLVAALNANSELRDQETSGSPLEGCGTHLEIQPSVTEFEMGSTQLNVSFGYNQGTVLAVDPTLPKATATDTLKVGHVQFTFTLYECPNSGTGECQSTGISSQATQTVLGNNLQLTVDWDALTGTLGLLSDADLITDIDKIMANGVQQIAANSLVSTLPWQAPVIALGNDDFIIGAGVDQNIKSTDYFTVYSVANSSSVSVCNVYEGYGCASPLSDEVLNDQSTLQIIKYFGSTQKPQLTDIVMVGEQGACFGN
jgi:hypothetical protein